MHTIAWVDGIPYSMLHLLCNRFTGYPGRGHRMISIVNEIEKLELVASKVISEDQSSLMEML